jgi:iron(III) transport system ATP-binding protein
VKPVEAAGVTVELGGRRVVGPLDITLEERSWTLLVGPSGCGKTTLLRALAGLVRPSGGEIRLAGRLASTAGRLHLAPERREVGFVFQGAGAGLWPHLSARATLGFVLGCRGVHGRERAARALELLELVGLEGLAERRPGELSGGEAQRLALARAMAGAPRILLLDEPLGPLDAELRTSLLAMLGTLHAELGWTTIHVTHDPAEAALHATRTVRLEHGRLAAQPTPSPR